MPSPVQWIVQIQLMMRNPSSRLLTQLMPRFGGFCRSQSSNWVAMLAAKRGSPETW